ncbi:hypothetical protein D9613_008454 [Agrocybe pediades]|uniref:Uncharacterized protein n=1 Tax=Agrocybe pediades TaxID=84607 RepID=A0A8H4VQ89_9AGAR|nr:hypothetical protein D9613_008454 [Agrocybe pediades]
MDLCFTKRRIPRSDLIAHEYFSRELEWRAWEKFGGQIGLDTAGATYRRDQRAAQPRNHDGDSYNNRRHQPAEAPRRELENGHGGGGGYAAPRRADYDADAVQRPIAAQPELEGRYFYARTEPSYPRALSIEGEGERYDRLASHVNVASTVTLSLSVQLVACHIRLTYKGMS